MADLEYLARLHTHPRDSRIQFSEEGHKYAIDGRTDGYQSTTEFYHRFFAPFDADTVIRKMMAKPSFAKGKYAGMTAEQIKQMWADKGANASRAGTLMHLAIEHFYNQAPIPEAAVDLPDFALFRDFQDDIGQHLTPWRTEWCVFDDEYKIAGSIDMLFKLPTGEFAIYDWKRSAEIRTENPYQSGYPPLDHIPDSNYWHYALQLNIYRYILRRLYDIRADEMYIIVLHPDTGRYRRMALPVMEDEVKAIFDARKRELEGGELIKGVRH
jgi:ATP-dependent exoDNAse (exonuclease V) beta subunit